MTRVALTGGAYQSRSVISAAQRCLNLYVEPLPEAEGEPSQAAHYPTAGTRLLGSIGPGPIRGIRQAVTGGIFVVSGSGVYLVDATTWTGTHLGDITPGLTTPVSMVDNGIDMVIVDGSANGWHVTLTGNVFGPIIQQGTLVASTQNAPTELIEQDTARYVQFTPSFDGRITTASLSIASGYLGTMKCSIFNSAADAPTDEIGSARDALNPFTGDNPFTFVNAVPVTAGQQYWIGFVSDTTAGIWQIDGDNIGNRSTTPFASFPVNSPATVGATGVVVSMRLESDPGGIFAGADRVDFLDTYLLFNKPGTPQFYASDSLSLTFDPLWFGNKEAYSDMLQTLVVVKRDIWLLGGSTTEIWADVGPQSALVSWPFQSQPDIFIDHGIASKYSAAEYDNGLFWLSHDRQGQGIVIMGAGYQTKRISTYAIEAEIAGYTTIADAIGFCYQLGGHAFYVLSFPAADKTWAYDITTGSWHEWVWIDGNGDEHRHRANCYWPCVTPVGSVPVIGDWRNGDLYALDLGIYTDNGTTIKRVRSFPHALADGKRVFYRQFLADIECGQARDTVWVISPPDNLPRETGALFTREDGAPMMREAGRSDMDMVSLRWSDDRGHTYGNPIMQSAGSAGEYLTSLQFQRLGMARDRVFEISWSTPAKRVLQGAWVDATSGMS